MKVNRRQFFKICTASIGSSSLALMGFSPNEALAEIRSFKLERTTETRNTCPYCSVGCGILMYSLGDNAKNAKSSIIHIEGDPDHPPWCQTSCRLKNLTLGHGGDNGNTVFRSIYRASVI